MTNLVAGTARSWVRTWSENGYGPWSAALAFVVAPPPPPGPATLMSPMGMVTSHVPSYMWNAVSGSTWYYLWVDDSMGTRITRWYTAAEAGCPNGTGSCSVTPMTVVNTGAAMWWIQTWSQWGYGPWSNGADFIVSDMPGASCLACHGPRH